MAENSESEKMQIRVHGTDEQPTLIYLAGLHGDWTLIGDFRKQVADKVRFVEITYPRTVVWSLDNYAEALEQCLAKYGITSGWLLAESYGSQVAWQLAARKNFSIQAIVLAGGFVKYPLPGGVWFARTSLKLFPLPLLIWLLVAYGKIARIRYRRAPETLLALNEFIARRTELDRQAMVHRLDQISAFDPRKIVRQLQIPVYQLSARLDPVVPFPLVRHWLRKNCPALRGTVAIGAIDHNLLTTAHYKCAQQILAWMGR